MTQNILAIIGAGGHTKDIRSIIFATNKQGPIRFKEIYVLDDNPDKSNVVGTNIYDQYLWLMSQYGRELCYIIGINDSATRARIDVDMAKIHAKAAGPIIHPTAVYQHGGKIGYGSILGPYTVLSADAEIGRHVHMNIGSSVNQGSKIGDYCTLSPGVRVCGDVTVGKSVQFGANSTIINLKMVGDNVILGAGAVVVRDLPSDVTAYGVPAKIKDEMINKIIKHQTDAKDLDEKIGQLKTHFFGETDNSKGFNINE